MIMRKHTLGYLDFLEGNYDENKHDTIVPLVEQMITSIQKSKNSRKYLIILIYYGMTLVKKQHTKNYSNSSKNKF